MESAVQLSFLLSVIYGIHEIVFVLCQTIIKDRRKAEDLRRRFIFWLLRFSLSFLLEKSSRWEWLEGLASFWQGTMRGGNRNENVKLWWQLWLLISASLWGMLWPVDDVGLEWREEIHAYRNREERLCHICYPQPPCQDVHRLYTGAWIHWKHLACLFIYFFIYSVATMNARHTLWLTITQ